MYFLREEGRITPYIGLTKKEIICELFFLQQNLMSPNIDVS